MTISSLITNVACTGTSDETHEKNTQRNHKKYGIANDKKGRQENEKRLAVHKLVNHMLG